MAVPTLTAPSVQPEAQPSPVEPVPQLGAFSGAHLGEGLTQVGKEIFGIGWEEYHKAAEAFAQQKENEFQNKALDLRDKYRVMYNMDAISAHDKYRKSLEELRASVGDSISSKYGKSLYSNNSLRGARFVQESMDQHFEEENKNFQKLTYQQGQETSARSIATYIDGRQYDRADDEIQKMYDRGYKYALSHGVPEDTAKEAANNDARKGTDAFLNMAQKSGVDPGVTQMFLDKYSKAGQVDAATQEKIQAAIHGSEVDRYVAGVSAKWEDMRVNDVRGRDGVLTKDKDGYVPYEALRAAIKEIPDGPRKEAKERALRAWWDKDWADFKRGGAQLQGVVVANGVVGNASDLDWQKYAALHPIEAAAMVKKEASWQYTQRRHSQITAKEMSHHSYGEVRSWLDTLSPEQVREITPDQVKEKLREHFAGPAKAVDPNDEARALEALKKHQANQLDPVMRRFHTIAYEALSQTFKGNRAKVMAAMGQAYAFLDDTYTASQGKASERDLREALEKETTKTNGVFGTKWFGDVPLLTYKSPRVPSNGGVVREVKVEAVKDLPAGTRYRVPGDPPDKWRTKGGK